MDLPLSLQVNSELSPELRNLHILVDLEVAILASHSSVKQLIEINKAILISNTHLQKVFLDFSLTIEILPEPKRLILVALVPFTELLEEIEKHLLLDPLAPVLLLRELNPHLHEALQVLLELDNHVLLGEVVQLELLDDNQDKQIEHDV